MWVTRGGEAVGRIVGWAIQRWAPIIMAHFRNVKMLYFSLL